MILRLLVLSILLPFWARADEALDSIRQLEALNRALSGQTYDTSCWMDPETTGKSCNATSDEFCRKLWDEGDGNMKVFDGVVRAGASPKSGISLAQLDDYRALANSLPRLPKDLAKAAAPALRELKNLLAREDDSKKWKRDLANTYRKFENAIEDVKEARKKAAGTRDEAGESRTKTKGKKASKKDETGLDQEIVNAKYAQSPKWRRVERLFPQAKLDLLNIVDTLSISEERKEHMRERIRTVTLKLPDGTDDCGTTQVNAAYSPEDHTFTVCAGMFNAYDTDSGIYQTIAHEISHSIDSNAEAANDYRHASPVARTLNRLVGAKGPVVHCGEWDKSTAEITATEPPKIRRSELDPFYGCLESRSDLHDWNENAVTGIADLQTKEAMSKLAKGHVFLSLAQPTFTEQGELKDNPAYLHPDVAMEEISTEDDKRKAAKPAAGNRAKAEPPPELRDANAAEIFTQVLACQHVNDKEGKSGEGVRYFPKAKDPKERREMFRQALLITEDLIRRQKQEYYSFCGLTCDELVAAGFSKDPSENFADWMANRASRYLYARIGTPENRQESAALGNALLCDEAGPKREAPGLAAEEKKFSSEEHPDARIRRISEYDPFVAHQLGCTLSKNQGFALCAP